MTPLIETLSCSDEAAYREVLAIRRRVFVEEQGVPAALEVDAYEREATFFLARLGGEPVATGRFRCKGSVLKFERIATLPVVRGQGVGAALMRRMEEEGARLHPRYLQYMHAQASAFSFYERIGWVKVGEPFHEAGIEHAVMIKPPAAAADVAGLLCLTEDSVAPSVRAYVAGRLR